MSKGARKGISRQLHEMVEPFNQMTDLLCVNFFEEIFAIKAPDTSIYQVEYKVTESLLIFLSGGDFSTLVEDFVYDSIGVEKFLKGIVGVADQRISLVFLILSKAMRKIIYAITIFLIKILIVEMVGVLNYTYPSDIEELVDAKITNALLLFSSRVNHSNPISFRAMTKATWKTRELFPFAAARAVLVFYIFVHAIFFMVFFYFFEKITFYKIFGEFLVTRLVTLASKTMLNRILIFSVKKDVFLYPIGGYLLAQKRSLVAALIYHVFQRTFTSNIKYYYMDRVVNKVFCKRMVALLMVMHKNIAIIFLELQEVVELVTMVLKNFMPKILLRSLQLLAKLQQKGLSNPFMDYKKTQLLPFFLKVNHWLLRLLNCLAHIY